MSTFQQEDEAHTACYCCWLAGVGGSPPCSYCTRDVDDEEDEEPVIEDPIKAYDRAMKGLS